MNEKDNLLTRIGLGTMMMGWRLDVRDSERIIALAADYNISLIDTSISYSRGRCHEILGQALKNLKFKNKFFIATKVGGISNDSDPPRDRGYSRHNIIRQCELSLKQLGVDNIDLLQLHNPTKKFASEEILETLELLIKQGKIKNYGISNYNETDTLEFLDCVKNNNFTKPLTSQFEYNLLNRNEKRNLFELAETLHLKTLTWGLLSSGLLTDWYLNNDNLRPNSRIDVGREKVDKNMILNLPKTRCLLDKISKYCFELNVPATIFSLLWVLKTRSNNSPLIGPSSFAQLTQLIEGVNNENYQNIDFTHLNL